MGCDSEVVRGASTCDAPVRSASNAATQRETQRDDPPLLALGHLQRGAANSQKGVPPSNPQRLHVQSQGCPEFDPPLA